MIVLDASAVLELILNTPAAERVARRALAAEETLHAPHLIDVEVVHVLRRYHAGGVLTAARGRQAIDDYLDLPITRYPHRFMLERAWEMRANVTAYDAVYLALAEALDAPLLTRDRRLAAVPGHRARIEIL